MKQKEKFHVTNDLFFQRIFGKVGNEEITKKFLERVLDVQIDSISLNTNKRLIGKEVDRKDCKIRCKSKIK